ncbi:MAG: hypothetical protein Q8P56_01345 [Candidatus Uhrbacteria bacterium]|nr:hypothetical protein [Candidatus Uhrbacteria bacterium]
MKQKIIFIALFATLGYLALQIPLTRLAGSKAAFTLYDCIAPLAGAFIGSIPGIVAVLSIQLVNLLVHGVQNADMGSVIRLFPMLFAIAYFAKRNIFNILIPALAIVVFLAHPIGRTVWYFSLFWLLPIVAYFLRDRFLLARALGATFTAHAVGGALWIWTFALPAPAWTALIPLVIKERLLFTLGIAGSFIVLNSLVCWVDRRNLFPVNFHFEPNHLLRPLHAYAQKK